ncbi:nucleotidyltransferase family protein [Deltaproteobacteria bacterium]|nr:nucleotidyltransferase family protein [Deltaproteobacteria bacterium]
MEKTQSHFTLHFTGYSMHPFLKPGDQIVVNRVSPESLQVGDIVVVPLKGRFVAHRLVKMLPGDRCVLKGDSMLKSDPEKFKLSAISGRVSAIIRGNRFLPVSTGPRAGFKGLYAMLSLKGLTIGALRLRARTILVGMFPLKKSDTTGREMGFILSTLGNRSPDIDSNLDWLRVSKIAFKEGIAGLLYGYIKKQDIPDPVLSLFKDAYHRAAAFNLMRITLLERLEEVLDDKNIEVMTLKGASLLDSVYSGAGMRPMDDLDLMVRAEDRKRLADLLLYLGFKRDPILPHFFIKDAVGIDLHVHALNIDRINSRAELFPLGMKPIWENSVPWKKGFRWLRSPDSVDNIFLLSQHLMKHSFSRLIWLMDLLQLARSGDDKFWARVYQRARYLKQKRLLTYTLYLLNKLFFYRPPMGIDFDDSIKKLTRIEKGLLETRIRGESLDPMGPLLALFCIHGTIKRAAFLLESLFPHREVIEREFPQSGGRRISFYLGRILQSLTLIHRRFSVILGALVRG